MSLALEVGRLDVDNVETELSARDLFEWVEFFDLREERSLQAAADAKADTAARDIVQNPRRYR